MPPPYYYLVNHTRKELCLFDNTKPIFTILENALNRNPHWLKTDDICIGSEGVGSTDFLGYLVNQLEYNENCPI